MCVAVTASGMSTAGSRFADGVAVQEGLSRNLAWLFGSLLKGRQMEPFVNGQNKVISARDYSFAESADIAAIERQSLSNIHILPGMFVVIFGLTMKARSYYARVVSELISYQAPNFYSGRIENCLDAW